MLDSARDVVDFSRGRSRVDLDSDRKLVLALVKAVEIIGEAAYQVTPVTRQRLPEIPCDDLVGMRHRLVHAYFDVNLDILWRTATDDVPALLRVLERIPLPRQSDSSCA
jgi:uncharacterized protein with HEPN domain